MTGIKQLLLQQIHDAFQGRPDMPLMASLSNITPEESSWQPDPTIPTIDQLVRHIAWSKSRFCLQGFGTPMPPTDNQVNSEGDHPTLPWQFPCGSAWGLHSHPGISGAISLLHSAQSIFTHCLQSLPEESLPHPIPSPHGSSAILFFSTMLMHDLYHAGQIRTRRTLYHLTLSNRDPNQ